MSASAASANSSSQPSSTVSVVGPEPIAFTNSTGGQSVIPLSALQFSNGQLQVSDAWKTALSNDESTLDTVAQTLVDAGELTQGSIPPAATPTGNQGGGATPTGGGATPTGGSSGGAGGKGGATSGGGSAPGDGQSGTTSGGGSSGGAGGKGGTTSGGGSATTGAG